MHPLPSASPSAESELDALRARVAELERELAAQQALQPDEWHERLRKAADAAEELQREYRLVVESMPQMVWTAGPEGQVTFCNDRWVEYTGLQEITQSAVEAALHPEDREPSRAQWLDCVREGRPFEREQRYRRIDGEYRWHLVRALPMRNGRGDVIKWLGTCTDVDDQRKAMEERTSLLARTEEALEALQVSELRFRRLADSNMIGVAFWRMDGRILEANEAFQELAGITLDDMLDGVSWAEITPPEFHARDAEAIAEVQRCGVAQPFEKEYLHRDGTRIPVLLGIALLEQSQRDGVAFAIDLRERHGVEQQLRRRTEELARSNEDLQQFAYVASHDLQEPLRTVASYVQLLAKRHQGTLGAESDEYMGYIVGAVSRMGELIRDLLAYARLGSAGPDRPPEPVPMESVHQWAMMNLHAALRESGATVECGPLPTVAGDQAQLAQLLQNLLGNAIKYRRPEEPLRVRVSATSVGRFWHFSVRDNGQGFEPQYAERIFGVFKRLHGRHYPGTGVGLAICKRIVERHGGQIWADGKAGQGATFHFTLPGAG